VPTTGGLQAEKHNEAGEPLKPDEEEDEVQVRCEKACYHFSGSVNTEEAYGCPPGKVRILP
jgi:hypothetical protein